MAKLYLLAINKVNKMSLLFFNKEKRINFV